MKSYKNWDVYYLFEYAYSFMLHGDGEPYLVSFENEGDRFCYVVMKSDIALNDKFKGLIPDDKYFDLETPYGYGGPLCDDPISLDSEKLFQKEFEDYCNVNGIVSQFVRFHPLLKNFEVLPNVIETRYLRDTIYMDTSDSELIMKNMDSKNRNMVRKAEKNGIKIIRTDISDFENFIPMYNITMERNQADDYYTFKKEYFESLESLKDNACIFYAIYEDKPVSGAIMYYNDKFMHYHLSGTITEYRQYSPGNLLLYEAAVYAASLGIKAFHLGGGMAPDDSLFGFKKQFNKNGRLPFVVGRTIFNKDAYDSLMKIRKNADKTFDMENGFMIQYRR